jgi:3-deoxy-D-manno-octulosonic-acid transferase
MTKKDQQFAINYSIKTAAQLAKILSQSPSVGTVAAAEALVREYKKKYPGTIKYFATLSNV